MRFALVLIIVLAAYWLTLSGYFKPLLLIFGSLSILFTVWMCKRMKILDFETVPYLASPKTLSYFIWLFREIAKANMAVVRAVLKPDVQINPSMIKVPMHQDTDIGRVMFGNSITLTPGTVTVEIMEGEILVHALLQEMADPEDFMEMGERAGWSIGEAVTND